MIQRWLCALIAAGLFALAMQGYAEAVVWPCQPTRLCQIIGICSCP